MCEVGSMTNREWLSKMSLIDMLTLFNQDRCIFETLDCDNVADRCEKFNNEELPVETCCYNCLCSWLNEKKFQKPLDKAKIV